MIKTEIISGNAVIMAPEKLQADDFRQIAPQIDSIISRYGKIRLLIDASGFNGWENIASFENHAAFVKSHQQKVDRIAVIVGHDWNRPVRLEGTVRLEETSGIGRDLGRPEGTGTIGTGRDDWKRRRLGRGGRRGMLELAKPQS